jgi:hypothetical protein
MKCPQMTQPNIDSSRTTERRLYGGREESAIAASGGTRTPDDLNESFSITVASDLDDGTGLAPRKSEVLISIVGVVAAETPGPGLCAPLVGGYGVRGRTVHHRRHVLVAFVGHLPQDGQVDVGERVDVDAGGPRGCTCRVSPGALPKPPRRSVRRGPGWPCAGRNRWRPRRLRGLRRSGSGIARILRSTVPTWRRLAGDVLHQIQQDFGIGSANGMLDRGDEIARIDVGGAQCRLGHGSSMPSTGLHAGALTDVVFGAGWDRLDWPQYGPGTLKTRRS